MSNPASQSQSSANVTTLYIGVEIVKTDSGGAGVHYGAVRPFIFALDTRSADSHTIERISNALNGTPLTGTDGQSRVFSLRPSKSLEFKDTESVSEDSVISLYTHFLTLHGATERDPSVINLSQEPLSSDFKGVFIITGSVDELKAEYKTAPKDKRRMITKDYLQFSIQA